MGEAWHSKKPTWTVNGTLLEGRKTCRHGGAGNFTSAFSLACFMSPRMMLWNHETPTNLSWFIARISTYLSLRKLCESDFQGCHDGIAEKNTANHRFKFSPGNTRHGVSSSVAACSWSPGDLEKHFVPEKRPGKTTNDIKSKISHSDKAERRGCWVQP